MKSVILLLVVVLGGCVTGTMPRTAQLGFMLEENDLARKGVVGVYEHKVNRYRLEFNNNGEGLAYEEPQGDSRLNWTSQYRWKLSEKGEIHVEWYGQDKDVIIQVYRINIDDSITFVAEIDKNYKRTDIPREKQKVYNTWGKIK